MERKINHLAICFTLFLILLFLSGSLSGILSEALYFLAFLLPLALGLSVTGEEKIPRDKYLSLSREDIKFALPIVFPTVTAVMLVSILTSILIKAVSGAENSVDIGDSFVPALILHALLPAVLEEMLFRYLPMRLLCHHSKRVTVLVSAAFFALVHHSLFSIPYAFLAGVIFMAVDIVCDSVIPSIILHFINNAVSVGMLVFRDNPAFAPAVFVILGILSVLSAVFIVVNRRSYKERFRQAFTGGEGFTFTLPTAAFAAVCLIMAAASII